MADPDEPAMILVYNPETQLWEQAELVSTIDFLIVENQAVREGLACWKWGHRERCPRTGMEAAAPGFVKLMAQGKFSINDAAELYLLVCDVMDDSDTPIAELLDD